MLLAAGAGSRLRPLTDFVPKPLAPIANVPLLERTLSWLRMQGVDEVVVNLHHHAEQIRLVVGDGERFGLRVWFSTEEDLLGTGGAIHRCAEHFKAEPFFVVYGDNLIDVDLRRLHRLHVQAKADATLGLFVPDDPSACGMVDVDTNGRVERFIEKPKPGETTATMANAGVYVVEPKLLETFPDGVSDFGHDLFPKWLAAGDAIAAFELGGYLQDTGTPDRYRKANWDVVTGITCHGPEGERVGGACVGHGSTIAGSARLSGRNIIGAGCKIGGEAFLSDCIVWPGAVIGERVELRNMIVGRGALVAAATSAVNGILI